MLGLVIKRREFLGGLALSVFLSPFLSSSVSAKSVFTTLFIRALGEEVDVIKDGYVTGNELGFYLNQNLSEYTKQQQTPQFVTIRDPDLTQGDIVFRALNASQFVGTNSPRPTFNLIVNHNDVTNNTPINKVEPAELPPPPDIEGATPIISMGYEDYDECEGPRVSFVTVAEYAKDDYSSDMLPTILQDKNRIRKTYYLNVASLSNAERSWVTEIFVPGRRLKIKYYLCGNGGIINLAYVEPLRASN